MNASAAATKDRHRRLRGGLALAILGPLTTLLIWGKLRFVSEMPRTAYAVPERAVDATPETRDEADSDASSRVTSQ